MTRERFPIASWAAAPICSASGWQRSQCFLWCDIQSFRTQNPGTDSGASRGRAQWFWMSRSGFHKSRDRKVRKVLRPKLGRLPHPPTTPEIMRGPPCSINIEHAYEPCEIGEKTRWLAQESKFHSLTCMRSICRSRRKSMQPLPTSSRRPLLCAASTYSGLKKTLPPPLE